MLSKLDEAMMCVCQASLCSGFLCLVFHVVSDYDCHMRGIENEEDYLAPRARRLGDIRCCYGIISVDVRRAVDSALTCILPYCSEPRSRS
jgi:hypothetical protein